MEATLPYSEFMSANNVEQKDIKTHFQSCANESTSRCANLNFIRLDWKIQNVMLPIPIVAHCSRIMLKETNKKI